MTTTNIHADLLASKGHLAIPDIARVLGDSQLSGICYAYKMRVKSTEKIVDKIERKRIEKPSYELANITDIVGLRLVALFKSDMVEIFEKIVSIIGHENGEIKNPFLKRQVESIEEIIVYNGTSAFNDIGSWLKSKFPQAKVAEKGSREGYTSIHLITRLDTHVESIGGDYKIPIEIQIRTAFEDAWGEIDHRHGYIFRSGKSKAVGNYHILSHLETLKKFTDACVDYAECIKNEAANIVGAPIPTSKVVSVGSDDEILNRLKQHRYSSHFIDSYSHALELKKEAEGSQRSSPGSYQTNSKYIEAAKEFRELLDLLPNQAQQNSFEKLVQYYCKMNEALCIMATNTMDNVRIAARIYANLENDYVNYPLLKMRAGQANSKIGNYPVGIEKLREAGDLAKQIFDSRKSPTEWPDNLPKSDYNYIKQAQPKLLGYALWIQIKNLNDEDHLGKAELFQEAYHITKQSLESIGSTDKIDILSIHNNLLYYAIGYISHAPAGSSEKIDEFKRQALIHLSQLESSELKFEQMNLEWIDTISKAYICLERVNDAKKVASVMLERCTNPDMQKNIDPQLLNSFITVAYNIKEREGIKYVD